MGGIKKENSEKVGSTSLADQKTVKATAEKKTAATKIAAAAKKSAPAGTKSVQKSETKSVSSVKATASSKSKKPVAGIDEEGTFRAWDNAKTVAKSKKTAPAGSAVEERALDKSDRRSREKT
ncbi:MAG: hypothetical protein II821_07690 [Treponema sp.]|nr:hypothetical protein [Treponema sp.]